MNGKVEEIKANLEEIKLKKVLFGGYDKKDVQMKLDMAIAMFEKCLKDQEEKANVTVQSYERKIRALNKTVIDLTDENEALVKKQYELKEGYKAYCGEIIKQYSESLRSLSGEFNRILEDVSTLQRGLNAEQVISGLDRVLEQKEDVVEVVEE